MKQTAQRPRLTTVGIAVVEIAFIIFLFYANLLMGEFTRSSDHKETLQHAVYNIVTIKTFAVALAAASIGFIGFDYLRKQV